MRNNRVAPSDQTVVEEAAPKTVSKWENKKTFASLAVEWDDHSKMVELEKQQQEHEKQQDVAFSRKAVMPLPRFHNVRRFVEPEETEEAPPKNVQPSNPEDEGWTTVDYKKHRRQKTIEEKANRPPTPEQDDTVWDGNAPEEHETCWEQRY
jgi:hypothetical protein